MEYVVIDTESCTGRSNDGSLCSVGYAVCDQNFNVIEKEDILINPLPKKFMIGDEKHAKKTGVTFAYPIEEFRKAPRFNLVYDKIKDVFRNRTVLGFSMANDVKYLNDACDQFALKRIEYEFYDVQYLYQILHPDQTSVGLKTLNEKFNIEYVEHRSDEDAVGSLILLKEFLKESNLTFEELIEKYKVHSGKNSLNGHHSCFSEVVFEEKYGLKISRRIQSLVFANYLKNLPIGLPSDKKVCFSFKIEKMDVNFTRTLIELLMKNGFYYDRDTDLVNLYVTDEKDDKRIAYLNSKQRSKLKILNLKELCERLGYKENLNFDDKEFLINLHSQLII